MASLETPQSHVRFRIAVFAAIALIIGVGLQFAFLPTNALPIELYLLPNSGYVVSLDSIQRFVEGVPVDIAVRVSRAEDPTNTEQVLVHVPEMASGMHLVPFDINVAPRIRVPASAEIYVLPSAFHRIWLSLLLASPIFTLELGVYFWIRARRHTTKALQEKIQIAEVKAEKEPEKVRPAWILAQTKLEAYFDRNLQQVNQVFFVAILVMIVGFAFIVTGVVLSFHEGKISATEIVASGSGIITEFIGATFMVIYRSTMAQANEFMSVLERINTVGMAVQVLDSIPEGEPTLKNETRARIIELLLLTNVRSKDSDKKKQADNAKES